MMSHYFGTRGRVGAAVRYHGFRFLWLFASANSAQPIPLSTSFILRFILPGGHTPVLRVVPLKMRAIILGLTMLKLMAKRRSSSGVQILTIAPSSQFRPHIVP
jgi:hypothetical protein